MSRVLFTSDQHFFHHNIIQFCRRPFKDVDDMNKQLIKRWNDNVDSTDVVYVLGDVSFGRPQETEDILRELRGLKHLIVGNHDRKGRAEDTNWDAHFLTTNDYLRYKSPRDMGGHKFVLCHFPFHSWERGYFNLHGHTHGTYASKYMQYDVGVDTNNYTPIELNEVVAKAYKNIKPDNWY